MKKIDNALKMIEHADVHELWDDIPFNKKLKLANLMIYDDNWDEETYIPPEQFDRIQVINSLSYAVCELNYKDLVVRIFDYIERMTITNDKELMSLHFYYQGMGNYYYAQRENEESLNKAITFYTKDIEAFPKYKEAFVRRYKAIPLIDSFKQIAIIYEKKGVNVKSLAFRSEPIFDKL